MNTLDLDTLYERSFDEPGLRPEFYRALLASSLYVLEADQMLFGERTLIVLHRSDGSECVPAYTSRNLLLRYGPTDKELSIPYTSRAISAIDLLNRSEDQTIHLNPGCPSSRDFSPEGISLLLAEGTIHNGAAVPFRPPEGIDLEISNEIPQFPQLEIALRQALEHRDDVTIAYFVLAQRLRDGRQSAGLLFVVGSPPSRALGRVVSTVFSDAYDGALPVDLCFDDGSRGLINIITSAGLPPFYCRID